MKPSQALQADRSETQHIVLMNRAHNPLVFGSVLRGVDTKVSDLDLLDIARIQQTLRRLMGVLWMF